MRKCRPGSSVIDIVTGIGIPDNESFTILLNGDSGSLNDILHEGDILSMIPIVDESPKSDMGTGGD